MPKITVNGRTLFYSETGSGTETVVFSHGYLMHHGMFAAQIAALSQRYRVIAYDHRGHGDSDTCQTPFDVYDLTEDAAALIRSLCDGPVHFAGMSTGGFVGLRLLLRHPDLIKTLTLMNTSAEVEAPAALRQFNLLLFVVRFIGIRPLLGKVLPNVFGPVFRKDATRRAELQRWKDDIAGLDTTSIRHFGRAIFDRDDLMDQLRMLEAPPDTLIIVGADDITTPPKHAHAMHDAIKGSELVIVPRAGHSTPVEAPEAVTKAMADFLRPHG